MKDQKLRPYQVKAAEEILAHLKAGEKPLLVAPTGAGKTAIAAEVAKHFKNVLVIAHRKEIIEQARDTFHWKVSCLSVQALAAGNKKTLRDLFPKKVDLLWTDEAHRAAAPSYAIVREMCPDAAWAGSTATPLRSDGKGLCDSFTAIVECSSMEELRELGYLVPYRAFEAPDEAFQKLASLKKVAGDYATGELSALMNTPRLVGDVVREYKKHGAGRKTVVFAVSVEHSKALTLAFQDAGIRTAHLDGTASDRMRRDGLEALRGGRMDVLCNVNLFTEGWDCPSVSCVIMARPTQSLTLYLQSVGRGMRPDDGKEDLLILDHAGNIARLGMPDEKREWSLESESEKGNRLKNEANKASLRALGFDSLEEYELEISRTRNITYSAIEAKDMLASSGISIGTGEPIGMFLSRRGIKGISRPGVNQSYRYLKADIDGLVRICLNSYSLQKCSELLDLPPSDASRFLKREGLSPIQGFRGTALRYPREMVDSLCSDISNSYSSHKASELLGTNKIYRLAERFGIRHKGHSASVRYSRDDIDRVSAELEKERANSYSKNELRAMCPSLHGYRRLLALAGERGVRASGAGRSIRYPRNTFNALIEELFKVPAKEIMAAEEACGPLLRGGEVAELLGLSWQETYKRIKSGEIPSIKCGGAIRVPREKIPELCRRCAICGAGLSVATTSTGRTLRRDASCVPCRLGARRKANARYSQRTRAFGRNGSMMTDAE